MTAPTALEIFAGAGGSLAGIQAAGFDHVGAVEINPIACETLRMNTNVPVFEKDISTFNLTEYKSRVDLLSGGPPCQPFSFGGKHQAAGDTRDLFPQAIRSVREIKPKAFLFENVPGIRRHKFQDYFEYVRLQLRHPDVVIGKNEAWSHHVSRLEKYETSGLNAGTSYNIIVHSINSADYGVPQNRARVFIAGFRDDLGIEWSFPEPTHSREALSWAQWESNEYWEKHAISKRAAKKMDGKVSAPRTKHKPILKPWVTVRDTLADLPDPELHPRLAKQFPQHDFHPGARTYKGHTGSTLDLPAKTLKAGVHGVPGGENMLRRSDGSVRYFSARECARLQTFDDAHQFSGSWGNIAKQIGNSVPVKLAYEISRSIAEEITTHQSHL